MFLGLTSISLQAQITKRERPKEWSQLVPGARFLDRFEAMPNGKLSSGTWGADSVRPRFINNGIEMDGFSFWGGNILQTPDKKYHLFVCGWPENSPKGHMFWPNSTVYHTMSDSLHGPFVICDTIGKGHNPEAFRLKNGQIIIYVINGYYIADSVDGPWTYGKFTFEPRDRKIIEGLTNLTFAKREDDSYLMICRGGGVWVSETGLTPYNQLSDRRVYPAVKGEFEDPVIWRDSIQYHLIVNDWLGRIAFYERSKDGIHWVVEQGEAYQPGISFHKDGQKEHWFKYERPKIFQDSIGRAVQMNFAVIDTIKWEDLPNDNHSSKNICIPLNKGVILSILNKKKITEKTKEIEVRISAEDDFDPQTEIDINSLRFGSYSKVNFGKGGEIIRFRVSGKDLIVTFKGEGSGITEDEFAPKMLGKYKDGTPLFGYAKMPFVDYRTSILSALRPVYDPNKEQLELVVQNFGTSSSKRAKVKVLNGDKLIAEARLQELKPYEKKTMNFLIKESQIDSKSNYSVIFYEKDKKEEINKFDSL